MAFPVRMSNDGLFIAVAEPSAELQQTLSAKSGHPVKLLIAPLSDVRWAIDSNYRAIGSVEKLYRSSNRSRDVVAKQLRPPDLNLSPMTLLLCRSSTAS